VVVHVALALLLPKTLWEMLQGGPRLKTSTRAHGGVKP
jgi:hypothetical protein